MKNTMMGDTVHDRVKKTGFVTGPNHMMYKDQPQMDADNDAPQGEKPPNLRDSDVPGQDCKVCTHYDEPNRECEKYSYPTKPIQVCDSFEAGEATGKGDESGLPGTDAAPMNGGPTY